MTYVEAISEIQKRSVDALKVVQSAQIASLQATRDFTEALITPPLALLSVPPFMGAMANLTRSVTFQLLDQQIACARSITETLVGPARSLSAATAPLALTSAAPLETLPAVTEVPVLATTLETIEAIEHIDEAILVEPTQAIDSAAATVAEPLLSDAAPSPVVEAVDLQSYAAEPESVAIYAAAPTVETVTAEAPTLEARTAEAPVVEAPVVEAPVVEAAAVEASALEASAAEVPAMEAATVAASTADDTPAAVEVRAAEPPVLHVDPADEVQTADVLAKALPPIDPVPLPRANVPKKAQKKPQPPAPPNNRAHSKRRPSK